MRLDPLLKAHDTLNARAIELCTPPWPRPCRSKRPALRPQRSGGHHYICRGQRSHDPAGDDLFGKVEAFVAQGTKRHGERVCEYAHGGSCLKDAEAPCAERAPSHPEPMYSEGSKPMNNE
ncbi:unnamed protein product [Effrenium voratum]|nr:unnamed protein product [Effrenium voratum]